LPSGNSLNSFDPFNFFNLDIFDFRRSSPENSATYSLRVLARLLPLSSAVESVNGPLKLLEARMVADQLVGLAAEIYLGELRKALEPARSNRSSVWLAMRPVFERIAGEIGQSPEFAPAFLSSQIVRELVKAERKLVEMDSKVDTENVVLLLYQAFLGTLLLWSFGGTPHLELVVRTAFHQLADV
jgi:hypothetical protein